MDVFHARKSRFLYTTFAKEGNYSHSVLDLASFFSPNCASLLCVCACISVHIVCPLFRPSPFDVLGCSAGDCISSEKASDHCV